MHNEVTVKSYYPQTNGIIELHPANKDFSIQRYNADEVAIQGKVIFLYNNWGKQFAFWRLVDLETGMSCDYFHLKLPMGDASKIDSLQFSMGTDVPDAEMTMDIRNLRLADAVY